MRRIGTMAAAFVALLASQSALAVIYTLHSTEISALSPTPVTFDFSLDTTTAVASGDTTLFNSVTIAKNGTPVAGNTVGAEFTTNLFSPLFFFVDTGATPFYSGLGTGIIFNTGKFAIADGATDGEGTLTIAVAGIPEPSTWAMAITGVMAIGIALRVARRHRTTMGLAA